MKRKFLILICLILFFVSVSGVSAAEDVNQTVDDGANDLVSSVDTLSVSATEDVNQTVDDVLSVSSDNEISAMDAGTFTALQEKIDNAGAGSTIYLENDYKYDQGFSSDGIVINHKITIDGNGQRVFDIHAYLELKNINFINGYNNVSSFLYAGKYGSYQTSPTINIDSCNFSDSTGGPAIVFGGEMEVYNSNFNNNNNGAIRGSCTHLTVKDSKFSNNYADDGAAIYYYPWVKSGKLNIENCMFTDNVASNLGGAVYASYGFSSDIKNSTFIRNQAKNGGAVYSPNYINIIQSNFFNNLAKEGGAIELYKGNVLNSFFMFNTAEKGGAISARNSLIDSCDFNNNDADIGGAIYTAEPIITSNNWLTEIYNCNFNDNAVSQSGASIAALGATNVYNCKFSETVNHESIYYKTHENKNKLNISDNKIDSDYTYDIYYNSTNSFDFKTFLVFENETVAPKDAVTICKLYDKDGNAIRIFNNKIYESGYDIKAILTNVDDSSIRYERSFGYFDEGTGGYRLRCDFKEGVYKVTGYLSSKFTDNCDVIDGYLTVGGSVLDVPDVTKDYGGPERLEITLTESGSPVANADVNININGADYTRTTDADGKASLGLNLNAGSYDATVTYKDISTNAKVVINKLTTKNTLSYAKNSHNSFTLTALVDPSTASGDVVFTVNDKDYLAKVNGGKATYTLNNLAVGSYSAAAKYNGDVNHKESTSGSVRFTVEEVKYDVSAPDLTKYYHGPEKFVVTVKEDNVPLAGKDVTINLNGKPYTRTTDSNGQASMAINLNSGVYNVTSQYEDIKVDSTITVKSTVSGNDVTKIFKNGTQYYATFVDTKGNLMKNTDVKFNINGIFYTRTTNDKGVAKMNINLPPKAEGYIITAENPNSTERYTNLIKVLPSIVENYDLTKYYKNASKYTLRIIGDDGKPVGEGVTVKLNINGVFYERKTNATGYMNMNINLPPGTYTVTAEYNGLMASNKITVLSVLETHNLVMKYKDGSKFEAKILDGQGRPYAGQTVTFNINGVFYTKTTEADGIARLKINLLAGEYIITSMYNGLNAANKVTISS
ncbi:Ig-like domain repeat protein [uncultured Methanobrevibacter sp.]|uniref:Ig-like domain repeat protein n=1 Tax=uncultured Methanobrevibacter sp. TaxID=253161 RepID=UPI0025FB995E|nr:Ig-like domain repeat protein [uncultured Methanobrevibacter sp.]